MTTDFTGVIPHGWQGAEPITKWWRGKLTHQYRLHKPCAECGEEMLFTCTKAAIMGTKDNPGLRLTRCEACRARSAEQPSHSRPTVAGAKPAAKSAFPSDELGRLREWEIVWLRALQILQSGNAGTTMLNVDQAVRGLMEASAKVFAELQPLKAELHALKKQHELGPAMAAVTIASPFRNEAAPGYTPRETPAPTPSNGFTKPPPWL